MRVRRLLIILITLGVSVVLLAPAIVQLVARHYINDARAQLEKQGIRLSVTGITGQLLGVTASSIDLWLPVRVGTRGAGFPIGLEFHDVSVSLLPSLRPRVRVTGEAYGGKFDLILSDLRNSTGQTLQAQLDSIDLGTHPQLNALGLSKALTSLTLEDARVPFDQHTGARASLKIKDASFSFSPRLIELIGGEFQQVFSLLRIDEITEARIQVEGSTENGAFFLRPIELSSSLGDVSGQARGTFDNGRGQPSLTASLRVDLSNGTSKLQSWLPLLSQNTLSSETTRFTTNVSSTSCANASVPTLRLGRLCLRSTLAPEPL
jgi:hypothetical protein